MSMLTQVVESTWGGSLIAALFHSIWQGVLIGGMLFFYLKGMSVQQPQRRYYAAVVALALLFSSFLVTWGLGQHRLDTAVPLKENGTAVDHGESKDGRSDLNVEAGQTVPPYEAATGEAKTPRRPSLAPNSMEWHAYVVALWGMGFVLMLLRLAVSLHGVRSLRLNAHVLEDPLLERLVDDLRSNMDLARKITIMVSEKVVSPCVGGVLVPLLLLPVSMVNGSIPTEDLKVMLAHELAHIKRHDYLVNVGQMLIEAVLFFNPAVWLISRAIRIEREICCDTLGSTYSESPARYARTLTAWAQRAASVETLPEVMMPWYGKEGSGLMGRVERLVCPAKMPRLKMPWPSIVTVILLFSLGCYILQGGTQKAADLVSRLLTPQQRIDEMERIAETYSSESQKGTPAELLVVHGSIRTSDKEGLGQGATLYYYSTAAGGDRVHTLDLTNNDSGFRFGVLPGALSLYVAAPGYVHQRVGPISVRPDEAIEKIDVVLHRGESTRFKFVNDLGQAQPNVQVLGYHFGRHFFRELSLKSDEEGLVTLTQTPAFPITIEYQAAGYSSGQSSEVLPEENGIHQCLLTRVRPTSGFVVSKETGAPVAGVEVLIKKIYGNGNREYDTSTLDSQLVVAAKTDEKGFFSLSSLRKDCSHILMFRKGKRFSYAFDVSLGSEALRVELPQPYRIRGRVTGSLDVLTLRDGKKVVEYHCHLVHQDSRDAANGGDKFVAVDEEGRFEITDLAGNITCIGNDQIRKPVEIDLWHEEVLLGTGPSSVTGESRKVTLIFDVPEGYPSPGGNVRVGYELDQPGGEASYDRLDVPIENFQAVFELPVPSVFRYRMEETIGYYFEEKWDIKLGRAKGPFVEHVDGIPGGAIYGVVLGPDGQEAKRPMIRVVTVKKSPLMGKRHLDIAINDWGSGPAKFSLPCLPMGGTYAVYSHRGSRFAISEPITITEENPIEHITLRFQEGQSFTGRIADSRGDAVSDIPCSLGYRTPWSGGAVVNTTMTLPDGTFSFHDINFDMAGTYFATIKPRDTWMPQEVEISGDTSGMTISLQRGERLEGVIVDNKTGFPIPGVTIYANAIVWKKKGNDSVQADGLTNDQGQFLFTRMKAKAYRLSIHPGKPIKQYNVAGGQGTPVIIRIELPKRSSIQVNTSAQAILADPGNDGSLSPGDLATEYRQDFSALSIRLSRLSSKSFFSFEAKRELHEHIFWLIKNHPDADISGHLRGYIDNNFLQRSAFAKAKALWLGQISDHPENAKIAANAASFFTSSNRDRAISLYQLAKRIEPQNSDWPQRLSHLYALETIGQTGASKVKAAKVALNEMELAFSLVTDEEKRMYILSELAKDSYEAQEIEKASSYAKQLLANPPSGHNYGGTVFQGNHILGRIALDENEIDLAKSYLLAAAQTPGSPVLGSFGPSMYLANELLKRGERDVVIEYFRLCSVFWEMGRDKLKHWEATVKRGGTPAFGFNLKR